MTVHADRRTFLRTCVVASASAAAGAWIAGGPRRGAPRALWADDQSPPRFEQRLEELGLELPPPAMPVATYVTAVVTGNLLYTAGHIPVGSDGKVLQGRVGQDLSLEQAADAARIVGLSLLSTVRHKLGSLDRVQRLVKVLGMVNCTPEFTQQPQVVNGFSQLMVDVFGEQAGKGARSAVGVVSLPLNCPVEIEAIFEIRAA